MSIACLLRSPIVSGSIVVAILMVLAIGCGGVSRGAHDELAGHDDSVPTSGAGGTPGTGGTGAVAASSPLGGSAGTPAPTDCALGGACRGEGSICGFVEAGACCATTYDCVAGIWSGPNYSDCGRVDCPSSPPREGSACGPCAGNCAYDTCTDDGSGQNLELDCVDGHWQAFDLACWTCCQSDDDCPNTQCVRGRCMSKDNGGSGRCYGDKECGQGQICAGAQICSCGDPAKCNHWEDLGRCVPADLGCCATNADCQPGETCIAGVCKPPAAADSCWSSLDCTTWRLGCNGVSVCPCGSSCLAPDAPGECAIPL